MTLYATPVSQPLQPLNLTKTFSIMVWTEMDRVRMSKRFYTVTMTGEQSATPAELAYEIDGKPATMQDVAEIIAWAKNGQGSIEKVAEELAA